MANPYYTRFYAFAPHTTASGGEVQSELDSVSSGMDALDVDVKRAITMPAGTEVELPDLAVDRIGMVIGFDAIGDVEVQPGVGNYRLDWATGEDYKVRDIIKDAGGALGLDNLYMCNTLHTSAAALTTDTAYWDLMVDVTAVVYSSQLAEAAATSAADSFIEFESQYLGAKASDPSVDNNDDNLIDGALYFNTTTNIMRVYDLGNTLWINVPSYTHPNHTGDVTSVGDGALTIANNAVTTAAIGAGAVTLTELSSPAVDTEKLYNGAVTLSKMADILSKRIIGRNAAGTGAPETLTADQTRSVIAAAGTGVTNIFTRAQRYPLEYLTDEPNVS